MAINFGAFFGPLLCGYLAQEYGWHRGFGAASVFMLCGLATYLYGYRYLPAKVEKLPTESASLSSADWRIVGALTAVIALTVFESIGYGQNANVFPVFAEAHVQLTVAGLRVPTPWYQSLDPFWAIAGVPMLFALWRYQTPRRGEPTDLVKMAIGAFVIGASNLILPLGLFVSGAERLHPLWAVVYFAIDSIGWLYYWPTLLAFVSRAAPSNVNATMMGITFMSLFVANNLVGWVGGYYEKMTPTAFWSMHAAVSALGGVLILLMAKPLSRVLSLERVTA